ncbi:MAG: ABC transporter ATP-binding protein, partial [Erysipelotrichales bacterium]|nr:ABC transporter ATP-binding protein [Erysipelotrichales bacterium]
MLEIKDLHAYYGPIEALKGLNLKVDEGAAVAIIGANGAGKTTLLNSISRMVKTTGSITWKGQELTTLNATKIAKMGIMHVPSGRHVFPGLTVYENLEVGSVNWHSPLRDGDYTKDLEFIYNLFPRLEERKNQLAWSLSGGEQQMLAVGRALMGRPKILLLDEPSMGLAPVVVNELFEKIDEINENGMTVLIVEQNSKVALHHSSYAYVIDDGKITMEGPSSELANDPRIV